MVAALTSLERHESHNHVVGDLRIKII